MHWITVGFVCMALCDKFYTPNSVTHVHVVWSDYPEIPRGVFL